jgi:acyl CoA:acetate/3-ketoacid CoA transferase alpha subunit
MSAGVKIPGIKKEAREIDGRRYVMEPSIKGDVAFVRAWKVDEVGNCVFRSVVPFCDFYEEFGALRIIFVKL